MATKNERAAQARAKAQAELKAKERRTTAIVIAVSLVVVAIFAGVVYFIVDASKTPTLTETATPAGADATGGILVDANEATVRVDVYLDFMCPWCGVFEQTNAEMLAAKSAAGDVALYYHPLGFLDGYSQGTEFSSRAANAAAVVADQSPAHFAAFFAAMFANQPEENTPGLDDAAIASIAVGVGVPQAVADSFADGHFRDWVAAASQQASIDGVGGTPTIKVNGEIVKQQEVPYMQEGALEQYLDSLVAD